MFVENCDNDLSRSVSNAFIRYGTVVSGHRFAGGKSSSRCSVNSSAFAIAMPIRDINASIGNALFSNGPTKSRWSVSMYFFRAGDPRGGVA